MEHSDATKEKWNSGNIQEKQTELKDGELQRDGTQWEQQQKS